MIEIKNIRIKEENKICKLIADIEYNNEIKSIWYSTDIANKKYLCYERADCFVIALLLFAMEKQEDIKVIRTPISSKLFQNLMVTFIPALSKAGNKYKKINIIADISNEALENEGYNGTGISCGIDSFTTLADYTSNTCPEDLRINCLTLFNMGSSGDYGGEDARTLYNARKERAQQFAKEYNFKFIEIDSNLSEYINMNFLKTHTLRNCSAVFAIQKLFKNYYYSSGISVLNFRLTHEDPATYDVFTLSMISTDNLSFYSTGTAYNRIEKTKIVSNYIPSYKYLNVCVKEDENCCECEKCLRTILGLQALGKLDEYNEVFDIKLINKNKKKNQRFLMKKVFEKTHWYEEIYELLKNNGNEISIIIKLEAYIVIFIKKLLPKKIIKFLKKIRGKQ